MKKVISVLLAFVIILSCVSVAAFSAGTKISESLAHKMDQAKDVEKIEALVWLYCNVDEDAAYRQALKECGYVVGLPLNMTIEEVDAYRTAYRRIITEQEEAAANSFVEKFGIAEEDIVYLGKSPYVIVNLTKSGISEIAAAEEVASIDLYDQNYFDSEYPTDPPYELPTEMYFEQVNLAERFEAWMSERHIDKYTDDYDGANMCQYIGYCEVYRSGNWALVYAIVNVLNPWDVWEHMCIGNRVIQWWTMGATYYPYGYFIYDYALDDFIPIDELDPSDYGKYRLPEVLDELNIGELRGDADGDGEVGILDATRIQRYKADMIGGTGLNLAAADIDGDGEVGILDATRIQRYTCEMCNIDGIILHDCAIDDVPYDPYVSPVK